MPYLLGPKSILCLTLRVTVMSVCIPKDKCFKTQHLCIYTRMCFDIPVHYTSALHVELHALQQAVYHEIHIDITHDLF